MKNSKVGFRAGWPWRLCMLLVVASICGLLPSFASEANACDRVLIISKLSKKCMDLANLKKTGNLHQYACHKRKNQLWRVLHHWRHQHIIRSYWDKSYALMAWGGAKGKEIVAYGLPPRTRTHDPLSRYKWNLLSVGGGYYQLQNAGHGLCIELKNANRTNQTRYVYGKCRRVAHQYFKFVHCHDCGVRRGLFDKVLNEIRKAGESVGGKIISTAKSVGKGIGSVATAIARETKNFAESRVSDVVRSSRMVSHHVKNAAKSVGKEALKQAATVGKVTKKGLERAYNESKKAANQIGKDVSYAAKRVAEGAQRAWSVFTNDLVKKELVKIAKKLFEAGKDEVVGRAVDKIKDVVDGSFKNKLVNIVNSKKAEIKKLVTSKSMSKSAARAVLRRNKGKFGMKKFNIKRMLKKQLNPKNWFKSFKKGVSKGSIVGKLVAVTADFGFMFASSAADCALAGHRGGTCAFRECFADKAADGTFDYVYALPLAPVMEIALMPVTMVCVAVTAPIAAVIPGAGLALQFVACNMGATGMVEDLINAHGGDKIKSALQSKIWTGGLTWKRDFVKMYGGHYGGYDSKNNRASGRVCPNPHKSISGSNNASKRSFKEMRGFDMGGHDYRNFKTRDLNRCRNTCKSEARCVAYAFNGSGCWLKHRLGGISRNSRVTIGFHGNPPGGIPR